VQLADGSSSGMQPGLSTGLLSGTRAQRQRDGQAFFADQYTCNNEDGFRQLFAAAGQEKIWKKLSRALPRAVVLSQCSVDSESGNESRRSFMEQGHGQNPAVAMAIGLHTYSAPG
jgi:hypothetical protein